MSDEKNYEAVDVVVQINSSYETSALFQEYCNENLSFIQDMGGPLITVGKIADRPICIAPLIHKVAGLNVLYVEATSGLVDWDMIDDWIRSKVHPSVSIISDPINLISQIFSLRNQAIAGKLKKKIKMVRSPKNVESLEPRYVKSYQAYPIRWEVTTTKDITEALEFDIDLANNFAANCNRAKYVANVDGDTKGFYEPIIFKE